MELNPLKTLVTIKVRYYVRGLVSMLGEKLHKYWKIGLHWLITIKNLLLEPLTKFAIRVIAQG
jgi:hypothetical protein